MFNAMNEVYRTHKGNNSLEKINVVIDSFEIHLEFVREWDKLYNGYNGLEEDKNQSGTLINLL